MYTQVSSSPATQRYSYTTNSLSISYRSIPYSPMQALSGATHHPPIIDISKYYNPNVIGDYPRRTPISHLHPTLSLEPIHEFIYRLTAKFFHNCSTQTPTLSFAKWGIILYSISTCSIENIYTNGSDTYCCKPYIGLPNRELYFT